MALRCLFTFLCFSFSRQDEREEKRREEKRRGEKRREGNRREQKKRAVADGETTDRLQIALQVSGTGQHNSAYSFNVGMKNNSIETNDLLLFSRCSGPSPETPRIFPLAVSSSTR